MEVPRPGVESELQRLAYTTAHSNEQCQILFLSFFLSFFFCLFRAAPKAYIEVPRLGVQPELKLEAASLHHSHSNSGSELRLQPILQLMATPDP